MLILIMMRSEYCRICCFHSWQGFCNSQNSIKLPSKQQYISA